MNRLCLAIALLVTQHTVMACNVPVFRYALERWAPDSYPAFIFHKGELSEADQKLIEWVNTADGVEAPIRNLYIEPLNVDAIEDETLLKIYQEQKSEKFPLMVVMYPPQSRVSTPLWSGEMTKANIEMLSDSPARREVVRRILKGDSATWVLIESGDKEADDKALKDLTDNFEELKKVLELPAQSELDFEDGPGAAEESSEIPLKLAFSVIRISRKDPKEAIFVDMLMKSESDLFDHASKPMAFPIFGRGRALYAYIGKGINPDTVGDACSFLTGACSCQIKEQNPGTDLLLSVDWDSVVTGSVVVDKALPPLSGAGDLIAGVNDASTPPESAGSGSETPSKTAAMAGNGTGSPTPNDTLIDDTPMEEDISKQESRESSPLARNTIIAIGLLIGGLLLGTLLVKK